ncbi:hypothetical protein J1605_008644 [Eschrichtius robustus]|uniref:Uncharacterized protein n=1 Tax=Eschrichtius robustus TaxID=9764 RepID=A0AB34GVT2_ESCRO|nr:hypothetical protein J1605_008644 [Eschrichtius robustus]
MGRGLGEDKPTWKPAGATPGTSVRYARPPTLSHHSEKTERIARQQLSAQAGLDRTQAVGWGRAGSRRQQPVLRAVGGRYPRPGLGPRSSLPGRPSPACAQPQYPAPGGRRVFPGLRGVRLRQRHQLRGRQATFQCPICRPGSSPGSRVQSSRGAVREMQLRFLSTLLRMVPTPPPPPLPPPPPPPCRFRHLPPRLREPVSLSCRIRERPGLPCGRRPPGSSLSRRRSGFARVGLGQTDLGGAGGSTKRSESQVQNASEMQLPTSSEQPCKSRSTDRRKNLAARRERWWKNYLRVGPWASLVAQWLRICLPMQGTRVRALVREDPTCRGATRPVSHNY